MARAATQVSDAWAQLDGLLRLSCGAAAPSPRVAGNIADAAFTAGREEEVLPIVAAAARRHGSVASLWQWTGLLYRNLDRQAEAIEAFGRAVQLEPRNARAHFGLARSSFDAGLPASALFERAVRFAPGDAGIMLGRADAWAAEGRAELAISQLEALLVGSPLWRGGHVHAAHLRWMMGYRTGFLRTIETALQTHPGELALHRTAIDLLLNGGLHDEAAKWTECARIACGDPPDLGSYRAIVTAERGGDADPLFAQLGPIDDIGLATFQVRYLLRTGRIEAARTEAERWLGHPQATMMWPYVATAWRLLGDPRADWLEDERLIGIYDIGDTLPPLGALAEALRALHANGGQQLDQSVRDGTQTIGPLLSRVEPMFKALRAGIVAVVERHIAQLPPRDPRHPTLSLQRHGPVRLTGSWSVRLGAGAGHHANHIHSQGWLSCVLYVAVPAEAERGAAPHGWLALGEPPAELALALPPRRLVEPRPGRLVLFPSTMWHGTRPFARGERMTVAFDVAAPIPRPGG